MLEPMTSQSAFSFPDPSSFSTQQATFTSFSPKQTSEPVTNSQPNPQNSNNFQNQLFQQYHTATLSSNNAKFPYLKKDEYETDSKGGIIILPPVSFKEHVAIQREIKAKTLLLQSLPKDQMADFHHLDDAREIWLVVKARFQKILSQLNQMQAKPDNDDVNIKFLRALPPSWSQVALILKIRGGLEYLSFDDLYNMLRSLEIDVKGGSSYGSKSTTVAPTHSAFIGAASINTKMVYSDQPSHSSLITYTSAHSGSIMKDVLHSFVAKNEPTQQLAYEDFEQAGRKINFNNKDSARFNRRKARCYNRLQLGHFARECNVKKVDEKARYSAFKISETEEGEQVYDLMAGFKSNFADHAGNAVGSVYNAAAELAMMGISPKVQTCPFGCDSQLSEFKKNYDYLEKLYNDSFIQVQAYKNTVKTLELQKDWYHNTQLALEEKVRILSANLENTTNTLKYFETFYDQAKIEKKEWEKNDLAAYTQRFQEFTMMCTKMVPEEKDRVEKGLLDNIQGNVIAAEPIKLQDAIRIANNLIDHKLKGYAVKNAKNKRRQGHYGVILKLEDQNHGNRAGNKNGVGKAKGKAYVLGRGDANPDLNVVKGMLGHPFNIDLMPVELGSFDVVIAMDCKREKSKLSIISCTKTQKYIKKGCIIFWAQVTKKETVNKSKEKRLKDVPTVRDYPKVFPEDLHGLPPMRQVKFQIELVPGAAPVARAPYRLAPSELDKSSASETYDFALCVSSPKTNDSFSTVDVKILPKSDVKDPSPTNGFPSCSFKENVKPPRNLCNKSGKADRIYCKNNFVRTKKCFVCGSKSHLIKDCNVNSSASTFAGRSIPSASSNRPASIYAGRYIPAGRFNKPALTS
nr:reverse transcriptase domain-containing protein [Tanacetum cinerariifolium]